MRGRPLTLVAVVALLAASPARPQEPAPGTSGPVFALRAGYGIPRGDVARGGPEVRDVVERKVPLGLELGYRFGRRVWGELFIELAPGSAASALCAEGTTCFASDARIGLTVLLRAAPRSLLDPWLGLGVGVEVMNAKGRDAASSSEHEWSWAGVELPFVEAGVDVAVSERVGIGPWASVTVGRFTSQSSEVGSGATGGTISGKIQDRATHSWLSAGLKATLKL